MCTDKFLKQINNSLQKKENTNLTYTVQHSKSLSKEKNEMKMDNINQKNKKQTKEKGKNADKTSKAKKTPDNKNITNV